MTWVKFVKTDYVFLDVELILYVRTMRRVSTTNVQVRVEEFNKIVCSSGLIGGKKSASFKFLQN